MATAVVAIGMSRISLVVVSAPLFGIAVALWLLMVLAAALRLWLNAPGLRAELHQPAALSVAASTAVLATGFAGLGWLGVAAALLILAAGLQFVIVGPVLKRWERPSRGMSFLLAVTVASLSVAASELARGWHSDWLVVPAGIYWGLAVVAYCLIASWFDLGELLRGRGDHWVSGGALAIAALAGEQIYLRLGGPGQPLEAVVIALWGAASAAITILLVSEVISPRWGYHHLRWTTVFPLGMYGLCGLTLAQLLNVGALMILARVFVGIGFAVWLLVTAGLFVASWARLSHPAQPESTKVG